MKVRIRGLNLRLIIFLALYLVTILLAQIIRIRGIALANLGIPDPQTQTFGARIGLSISASLSGWVNLFVFGTDVTPYRFLICKCCKRRQKYNSDKTGLPLQALSFGS